MDMESGLDERTLKLFMKTGLDLMTLSNGFTIKYFPNGAMSDALTSEQCEKLESLLVEVNRLNKAVRKRDIK